MVIDCFGKLYVVSEPIYRPKGIDEIHLEYLTILSIVATISLINEVKHLCGQAKYREKT